MKQILIIISTAALLYSCGSKSSASNSSKINIPKNFIVLLDLSDRLINNPSQTDIDTSAIRVAFEKFEMAVKRNLVVKSKDKFSVRVIPQQGSNLPINNFENSLSIDLGSYSAAEKLKKLNEFREQLGNRIKMLYQQAYLGNKSSDYFGVDIWQYFNEQVNTDILDGYNNHVLILTDGYFDFEDKNRGLNNSSQSTVSRHLMNQLKVANWKEYAEKNNIGIIPVKLKPNVNFVISGIQTKTNDILESTKLSYLWTKWLTQSGVQNVNIPFVNASSGKIKSLIKDSL